MYIIKNALRCIWRAKGRNLLIGAVVLLLSVSSCIGLSIKQANKTLKKQYADDMEISATVNSKNMRENGSVSLDTLNNLSSDKSVKDFYYSSSVYFAAGDNIEPLDVAGSFKQNKDFREEHGNIRNGQQTTSSIEAEGTSATSSYKVVPLADTSESQEKQEIQEKQETQSQESTSSEESKNNNGQDNTDNNQPPQLPSGEQPSGQPDGNGGGGGNTFITNNFFFNMASMNDFTVIGYSSSKGLPEYVLKLDVIDSESTELNCVISKNLADENEFENGDTFTLKNPDNEDETYEFTIVGICDASQSSNIQNTSSNASFQDNCIYVSGKAIENILSSSAETNPATDETEETNALTPTYAGTFVFANLDDYNAFGKTLSDEYTLVSEDVSNYEQSISQLETLGKYATYFLIVIFIIGAFVLVIINMFNIRNRKYEIGVLTAIGMKKYKVAMQFVIELFVVTFAAIIIGSAVGAVTSVPVTNSLLVTVNSENNTETNNVEEKKMPDMPENMQDMPKEDFKDRMQGFKGNVNGYIAKVSSATDVTVILQMILVGMGLTLVSSAAAIAFVMRYEPLKILNNRD